MTLRLVTDNARRTIGTPEDEWRRLSDELEARVRANPDPRPAVHLAIGRDGLFFIAGAATALYVIGVIALAGAL
jgi:hypothetical protein